MNFKPLRHYLLTFHKILLLSICLSGCSFIQFYPYQGVQKNWPINDGAFADNAGSVPVFIGFPPRPYYLVGMVTTNFASDASAWAKRMQWCHQAKKNGADAVVILQQDQVFSGMIGGGSGSSSSFVNSNSAVNATSTILPGFPSTINTTGTINSNLTGESYGSYTSWSAPTYREHTTAWLIKWR